MERFSDADFFSFPPTVTLQLVCDENCSGSNCDQHKDQRLGPRHWKTFKQNDGASKAMCRLCRCVPEGSTDIGTVESMQHVAKSKH